MSDGRSGSKAARVQFDLQAPSKHGGTEPMTNQPTAPGSGAANLACAKYDKTISTMSDGCTGSKAAGVQFDPQAPSKDGDTRADDEPTHSLRTSAGGGGARPSMHSPGENMAVTPQDTWSFEEDETVTASLEEAQAHDVYWARAYARENYFRAGLDYEDYAPAYCVGYVGCVQYGGSFDDAEKSLLANWIRIKGNSRLGLDEARTAIRNAWNHAAEPVCQVRALGTLPARSTQHDFNDER